LTNSLFDTHSGKNGTSPKTIEPRHGDSTCGALTFHDAEELGDAWKLRSGGISEVDAAASDFRENVQKGTVANFRSF
jgi:hypothetical protein